MAFHFQRVSAQKAILHTGTILIVGDPSFKEFEACLSKVVRQCTDLVIIDFSECIYIDSHAIRTIISMNRRLNASGGKLQIQNTNQKISGLLRAIQLDRIIEMV